MPETIVNPINMTTTPTLHVTLQNYADGKLLKNMEDKLVYHANGVKRKLPKGNGQVMEFWRYQKMGAITDPLQEAVIPEAQTFSQAKITATVDSYGGYLAISDKLDMTMINYQTRQLVELLSDQAALSIDTKVRDVMMNTTNVLYSGNKSQASALTATDILCVDDIRRGVRKLDKKGARKFTRGGKGYYKCIIGADAVFALQSDPKWIDVATYQQAEKIENGEIGKLYGVIFILTSNNKISTGAGASGVDVDTAFLFGDESYAVVSLGDAGDNAHIITKGFTEGGVANPLNQVSTIGWKVDGMTTVILNPDWLLRIDSAVAA